MKYLFRTLLWLILCVVFIYLVDLFTVEPHVISGNGNLGLLLVGPALLFFVLFAKSLWKSLGNLRLKPSTSIVSAITAIALFFLFCYLEYKFTMKLIDDLGGSPEEPASRIYRFSWLNQYTNTIFINAYTFGILATGTIFLRISLNRTKDKQLSN